MLTKQSHPTRSNEEVLDPITNPDRVGHVPMTLHPKEAALIMLIRHLGQGVIEQVTIKEGLPQSIQRTEQRFILDNMNVLSKMFEKDGSFFSLSKS